MSKCHIVGNHMIFLLIFYFRHSEDLIRKLEQAGLGYHVDADKTTDRLGKMSCIYSRIFQAGPQIRVLN